MQFLVKRKDELNDNSISIIIQEKAETLFHIELREEENTIKGWYNRFIYLHNQRHQALNDLLVAIPPLLQIQVYEEAHVTYLKMLHALRALLEWLETEAHGSEEQVSRVYGSYTLEELRQLLEHALFHFSVDTSNTEYYEAIFAHPGEEMLRIKIPSDKFDKAPVPVSQATLSFAYERRPKPISYFIDYYIHFQAYIDGRANSTTSAVFTGLSKALVKLIKQENYSLGIYISLVPDICAFIVKNELDGEEQKVYLEPILSSLEKVEKKTERLEIIINHIIDDASQRKAANESRPEQQKEEEHKRLMHVISLISDHFLRVYDLDRSANFWRKAKSKDPLLRFFLILHRWPLLFLLLQLLLLGIPSWYAFQHWQNPKADPFMISGPYVAIIAMLLLYALLLLLLCFILFEIIRKRWLYSQLLIPRLLGAAVIGLLPLLLNDQSWEIGLHQLNIFSAFFLAFFTYSASFMYVFIEVHNVKKFVQGHSLTEVLKETSRIFFIALSETLFIVTITSTLIFPALSSSFLQDLGGRVFAFYATAPVPFGFFPILILLWTGIALFIGSFVQLLWQDRRITEST